MALTGLKDDYVEDGRVLTEDLSIRPGRTADPRFQPLAVCYKQLNSSVGRFATDVLVADTAALKTGSITSDRTYAFVSLELRILGAVRDAVATQIKDDLYNAEFNDTPIPDANAGLARCEGVLRAADGLARGTDEER